MPTRTCDCESYLHPMKLWTWSAISGPQLARSELVGHSSDLRVIHVCNTWYSTSIALEACTEHLAQQIFPANTDTFFVTIMSVCGAVHVPQFNERNCPTDEVERGCDVSNACSPQQLSSNQVRRMQHLANVL